jgi:hypothetical protein
MTRFLKWRKMTWALLLWGALIGLWMVSGTFALALLAGVLGLIVLVVMWFLTMPLWRQGHGARLRRMRSVEVPFKPVRVCRLLAQLDVGRWRRRAGRLRLGRATGLYSGGCVPTRVHFTGGRSIIVEEDFDQVQQRLEHEAASSR